MEEFTIRVKSNDMKRPKWQILTPCNINIPERNEDETIYKYIRTWKLLVIQDVTKPMYTIL